MRFALLAFRLVPLALGLLVATAYLCDFGGRSQVKHVSDAEFEANVLRCQAPVLVDFYATWCGPCRQLAPVLEEVAGETSQVKFVKMDVDQHRDLAMAFDVHAIPCLILFKNGQVQTRQVGFQGKEGIEAMLQPYASQVAAAQRNAHGD